MSDAQNARGHVTADVCQGQMVCTPTLGSQRRSHAADVKDTRLLRTLLWWIFTLQDLSGWNPPVAILACTSCISIPQPAGSFLQ